MGNIFNNYRQLGLGDLAAPRRVSNEPQFDLAQRLANTDSRWNEILLFSPLFREVFA